MARFFLLPSRTTADTAATHVADHNTLHALSPLSQQGAWSSATTYAVNDVVSRAYALYAALLASTNSDPASTAAPAVLGANTVVSTTNTGTNNVYQQFTVNTSVIVSKLEVLSGSGGAIGAGETLAITLDDRTTVLGTAVVLAGNAAGSSAYASVTFATPVALSPGVTYRVYSTSNGTGVTALNAATSPSGVVATVGTLYVAGGEQVRSLSFRLDGSPWQKIANVESQVGVGSKTAAYTMVPTDGVVLANGTFAVTLPPAASAIVGHRYAVKNTGTGTVTITPQSGTIDGASNFPLTVQYSSLDVVTDGTNWFTV